MKIIFETDEGVPVSFSDLLQENPFLFVLVRHLG
jgi:hypothetical protein